MVTIRLGTSEDILPAQQLNDLEVPRVNALSTADFRHLLLNVSDHFWVAMIDGVWSGFAVTLCPDRPYDSINYRWFSERYTNYLYLDRIVVAAAARRKGVGRALYQRVFETAASLGAEHVLCEVNAIPANPISARFHAQLGFLEIGRRRNSPDKEVIFLARDMMGS